MMEHLHPNVNGYFFMAEGFLQAMKERGFIETHWDSTRILPWTYYRQHWGFGELDSMIAVLRIKRLKAGWPFQPEISANNFFFTYAPKGIIDSLAFMSVKYDNISSEMVHKQLAEYYESFGDFKHSSQEYLSIAYTTPTNALAFYYAADFASKANDYTNAIRCLKESPNPDTSSHAQLILASLYLFQRNFREALHCVDKLQQLPAGENNSFQVQKLKYRILKDSGLVDEAAKTLALLKKKNPSFQESGTASVVSIFVPNAIKPYIDRAEALRKNGQLSKALAVLKDANTIQEIAYTNLLIGKILFTQKNLRALLYLEKAHKEIKEDPSLSFSLCTLYLLKGNFREAKAALDDYAMLQGESDPQVLRLKATFEKEVKKRDRISER
jgi:tetratricopeptide (TPR) repeat protein